MSNRLTSGTFYEDDKLNHFIITKVTLFRGKEQQGWIQDFCLGGGAPISCSTLTPINHIVFFFFAEYQLY